jgi:dihydroneopterin aldolase
MSDAIVITGIAAAGRHGVFDHERATGQRFLADLTLEINLSAAGRTDDLDETVDYGAIADAVVEVLAGPPFALIEAVAEAIASRVLEDWPQVDAVEVTVHKPDAPIAQAFTDVAVRIRRSRTA